MRRQVIRMMVTPVHGVEVTGNPKSPSSDGWQLECKKNIVTGSKLI
jgi:hypothetical protein